MKKKFCRERQGRTVSGARLVHVEAVRGRRLSGRGLVPRCGFACSTSNRLRRSASAHAVEHFLICRNVASSTCRWKSCPRALNRNVSLRHWFVCEPPRWPGGAGKRSLDVWDVWLSAVPAFHRLWVTDHLLGAGAGRGDVGAARRVYVHGISTTSTPIRCMRREGSSARR